jgi:hypothetical protein
VRCTGYQGPEHVPRKGAWLSDSAGGGTKNLKRRRALDTRTRWVQSWSEDKETIAIGPCLAPLHLFTFVFYRHKKETHTCSNSILPNSYCNVTAYCALVSQSTVPRSWRLLYGKCLAVHSSHRAHSAVTCSPTSTLSYLALVTHSKELLAAPQFLISPKYLHAENIKLPDREE